MTFRQGDASTPPYPPGTFDVVLSRHVLWAMRDRSEAVRAWTDLLRPGGRLLLVEVGAHERDPTSRRFRRPGAFGGRNVATIGC